MARSSKEVTPVPQPGPRRSEGAPIPIGLLFSQTGVTAVMESSMLRAAYLAIEEVNQAGGIEGRELLPVVYDPAGEHAKFQGLANRLLTEDGVKVIVGCYMSSSRKAVLPVIERLDGLLCYPTQYEGFECSPNIVYAGAVLNQTSLLLGRYLLDKVGRRFFMAGADYIWPWEASRVMGEIIREGGGEVLGQRFLKLDATRRDYDVLIHDILRDPPDGIFCNFVGDGIVKLHHAFAEAGLDPATMPIISLTTSEADVQAIGHAASVGHITLASYFQSVDTPANRRCMETVRRRFGPDEVTHMCWESVYFQVHMLAEALREVGSDSSYLLRPALMGREFEAPQGRIRLDPDNGHTYLRPRIGRVNARGQFDIIVEGDQAMKPDPYLVSHEPLDRGAFATG